MGKFDINVTYDGLTKFFSCSTRREFGSAVARFFGVDKSQIQFFDITKNSRNPITINDLSNKMKIEIKTNGTPPNINFERLEATETEAVKVPDLVELERKLRDNRALTGIDRKFLIQLAKDFSENASSTSRKRKRVSEDDPPIETLNKKIQVDMSVRTQRSYHTQTDAIITQITAVKTEQPPSSEDLISQSKKMARLQKKDAAKVRNIMDKTFDDRRQFILLSNPVLTIVKERYPLLFSNDEVRNELNRIFYDGKDAEFLSNVEKYKKAILGLVHEDNAFFKVIQDAVDEAVTNNQKDYASQVGAILLLSNAMNEKRTYLYTEDEPCEKNNYPRIEAPCTVSELFRDVNTYRIIVEGIVLCEASTFPEAILCLIACFFIFNISYPDKAFKTFVAMEKLFLDANDTDGNEVDDSALQVIRLVQCKTGSNK